MYQSIRLATGLYWCKCNDTLVLQSARGSSRFCPLVDWIAWLEAVMFNFKPCGIWSILKFIKIRTTFIKTKLIDDWGSLLNIHKLALVLNICVFWMVIESVKLWFWNKQNAQTTSFKVSDAFAELFAWKTKLVVTVSCNSLRYLSQIDTCMRRIGHSDWETG